MPLGVFVDCAAVFLGGLIGALAGKGLKERTHAYLTVVFGFCAMAIGINSIVKVSAMTPVILSIVVGCLLGDLLQVEECIQALAEAALNRLPRQGETDMDQLLTVIVLFCFSGFGIYGVFLSSMSGDHTLLLSKAVLDCFTALVFAITVGLPVMLVSLPMMGVMLLLFSLGKVIAPLMSDAMLRDFMACGGILTLVTGLRVAGIKKTPIANMIPALVLVLPLSWLWSLLPF